MWNNNVVIHQFSPRDQQMADTFRFYWTNMATSHAPGGGDANSSYPAWPAYDAQGDRHLVLDVPPRTDAHLYAVQCDFWDTVPFDAVQDADGRVASVQASVANRVVAHERALRVSAAVQQMRAAQPNVSAIKHWLDAVRAVSAASMTA